MAEKKVEITITKFYIFAWLFGLTSLGCFWYNHWIVGFILLFFCFSYSIADYSNPPYEK